MGDGLLVCPGPRWETWGSLGMMVTCRGHIPTHCFCLRLSFLCDVLAVGAVKSPYCWKNKFQETFSNHLKKASPNQFQVVLSLKQTKSFLKANASFRFVFSFWRIRPPKGDEFGRFRCKRRQVLWRFPRGWPSPTSPGRCHSRWTHYSSYSHVCCTNQVVHGQNFGESPSCSCSKSRIFSSNPPGNLHIPRKGKRKIILFKSAMYHHVHFPELVQLPDFYLPTFGWFLDIFMVNAR